MTEQRHDEPAGQVPAWFHAYALENERQHAKLSERIAETETRLVRWVVGSVGVASAIIVLFQRFFS